MECSLVHDVGFGVVDASRGAGLIGEESLKRHKSKLPSGEVVEWEPNGNTDRSVGVVRLSCCIAGRRRVLKLHVVPAKTC